MQTTELRQGSLFAIAAFFMWGFGPLYFTAIAEVSADEILMHRVIWSFGLVLGIVFLQRRMDAIRQLLKSPKTIGVLAISSLLVGSNWLVFIWAVTNGHILDASLGYFINPLVSIALGMAFLSERLRPLQLLSVGLAIAGVIVQLVQFGSVPWISLFLAISFGLYGLVRKKINLQASTGLLIETAIMLPLALAYWFYLDTETANLATNALPLNVLLILAGLVTTLPLLCFAAAAIRLPLYLLGMLQYIGPIIMFIMALTLFGETLELAQGVTFGFIWISLLVMSADIIYHARKKKRSQASPTEVVKA